MLWPAAGAILVLTAVSSSQPPVPQERTLIGCIERSRDDDGLLLTHTRLGTRRDRDGAGAPSVQAVYRLTGITEPQLERLVGKTVSVVGFVEKESPRTGGPMASNDPDERRGDSARRFSTAASTFRTRTVRSLSSTCTDR